MKHFLIRHGQSISNAGARTPDLTTIPLSELGRKQANTLVPALEFLNVARIFCSPFARAQETAEPFHKKHPEIPLEIIPIEEFLHLDPETCKNTTEDERRPRRKEFWARKDPDYKDGPGSESFNMLLERTAILKKIILSTQETSAFFGHGRFFSIFCLQIQNPEATPTELLTLSYQTIHEEKRNFPNGVIFPITTTSDGKIQPPNIPYSESN